MVTYLWQCWDNSATRINVLICLQPSRDEEFGCSRVMRRSGVSMIGPQPTNMDKRLIVIRTQWIDTSKAEKYLKSILEERRKML